MLKELTDPLAARNTRVKMTILFSHELGLLPTVSTTYYHHPAMAQVLTQTPLMNGSAPEALQNGSADGQVTGGNFLRFSGGLILPPPEIKGVSSLLNFALVNCMLILDLSQKFQLLSTKQQRSSPIPRTPLNSRTKSEKANVQILNSRS